MHVCLIMHEIQAYCSTRKGFWENTVTLKVVYEDKYISSRTLKDIKILRILLREINIFHNFAVEMIFRNNFSIMPIFTTIISKAIKFQLQQ